MLGEVISIYTLLAVHDPMSLGTAFQRSLTSVICTCLLCAREVVDASLELIIYCVGAGMCSAHQNLTLYDIVDKFSSQRG